MSTKNDVSSSDEASRDAELSEADLEQVAGGVGIVLPRPAPRFEDPTFRKGFEDPTFVKGFEDPTFLKR